MTTSTAMVTARQATTATTMATDIDDNNDEGDDASLTTCDKGDNRNCDAGEDACASTATTPEHWRTSWCEQRGGVEDRRVRWLRNESDAR